jgi:hypothetical protein
MVTAFLASGLVSALFGAGLATRPVFMDLRRGDVWLRFGATIVYANPVHGSSNSANQLFSPFFESCMGVAMELWSE